MPRVGILKTAQGFALTQPTSRKSAVVSLDENLLESLLANEAGQNEQAILGELYGKARREETAWSKFKTQFYTETAFWHIHGILATALFLISTFFAVGLAAGAVPARTDAPTFLLIGLVVSAYATSIYSLVGLFTGCRVRKARAALGLFMWYLYLLVYLTLTDGVNETLSITLLSLAGVAVVLYTEWSRPTE
jgi:hypothetical protein